MSMIDFDARAVLRDNPQLLALLTVYGSNGDWHDREMSWPGASAAELSRWHGRLLAGDWIEVNITAAPRVSPDEVPASYRATAAGRRAIKELL